MTAGPRKRVRPDKPKDPRALAMLLAAAAFRKRAQDPVLLEVGELAGFADYFFIVSGRSTRQATAIAEEMLHVLKKAGLPPLGKEGVKEGRWALLDFGDVVAHVFHEPVREFYDLESFWGDAPRIEVDEKALEGLIPAALGQTPDFDDDDEEDTEEI